MAKPRKVSLIWRCKTPRGWRRFSAILEKHPQGGMQAKHGWVMDGNQLVSYQTGSYELRTYNSDGDKEYAPLDTCNPVTAVERLHLARRAALKSANDTGRESLLQVAAQNYIDKCETDGKMGAWRDAKLVMGEFLRLCKVKYTRGVKIEDVNQYLASLRKRGNSKRTVRNKHDRLMWFLRYAKGDPETIATMKKDRPTATEKKPDTYTSDQLSAILNAADEYMRLVILFGSRCGLREMEIAHAAWSWINWENSTLHVKDSPEHGWQIKDKEERICPIPSVLLSALKAWRKAHPKTRLIVGTDGDRPNTHLLRALKRLAKAAGLNCNQCEGCKPRRRREGSRMVNVGEECEQWTLHRLRRTAATSLLRHGVDVRTVSEWFGWADLETARRYLQAADAGSQETRARVDAAFADV